MLVSGDTETEHFTHLVETLHPWLSSVVFIGGWAHRLYRLHPLAGHQNYEPIGTWDADVAIPTDVRTTEESIRDRLLANDFREELIGDLRPPAAQYFVRGDSGFYAEFLAPLQGSSINRKGERDVTTRINGVLVQKLRYLDLLLEAPWTISLSVAIGYPVKEPRNIRIPNPTAYLAQKLLIHKERYPDDRAKDLLYIHDTLEMFGAQLSVLRGEWQRNVKPGLATRATRAIEAGADLLFGEVTDALREAARIADARNLTADGIRELCHYGWEEVYSER